VHFFVTNTLYYLPAFNILHAISGLLNLFHYIQFSVSYSTTVSIVLLIYNIWLVQSKFLFVERQYLWKNRTNTTYL